MVLASFGSFIWLIKKILCCAVVLHSDAMGLADWLLPENSELVIWSHHTRFLSRYPGAARDDQHASTSLLWYLGSPRNVFWLMSLSAITKDSAVERTGWSLDSIAKFSKDACLFLSPGTSIWTWICFRNVLTWSEFGFKHRLGPALLGWFVLAQPCEGCLMAGEMLLAQLVLSYSKTPRHQIHLNSFCLLSILWRDMVFMLCLFEWLHSQLTLSGEGWMAGM